MSCVVYRFLLACSALMLQQSCAKTPGEPSEVIVEWSGHALREVKTLHKLPNGLQTALGVGVPGDNGIADRNGKYNATDVIDSRLPMRRFLIAGLDDDAALIAFEQGGRGWRVEVNLFSNISGKLTVERRWSLFESPGTLRDLVDQLPVN